jgi:tripartite-type tricarboxylate transporter receptor subunit TctC
MFGADIEERALQQGFRLSPKGEDEFARFLKSETDRWGRLIKAAKITAT